jgi:hypothetical protein
MKNLLFARTVTPSLIAAALMLSVSGCGLAGEAEPATYRGRLDESNTLGIKGDVIFTLDTNGDVLGTLKGEIAPNDKTFIWRGDLEKLNYVGTLKNADVSTVDVNGTITASSGRLFLTLTLKQDGVSDDVSFTMDKL